MRRIFKFKNGQMVEVYRDDPRQRIAIVPDTMDPIQSHHNNKMYDSWSAYKKDLARDGFAIVEGDIKEQAKKRFEAWERKQETAEQTMHRVLERYETSSSYREELRQKREYHQK